MRYENIMQKYTKPIVLLALLVATMSAGAADFSAVAPSGQTIYYNIVAGGVQVVYPAASSTPSSGWVGYTKPTGALTIPATVTNGGTTYAVVAVDKFAFYNCTGLTSVVVPEGVTAVRASAIRGCTALTTVILPSTLDSLANYSLADCPALSTLTLHCSTPPATQANTFSNDSLGAVTLYVPCGTTAAYSTVSPWSLFGSVTDDGCIITIAVAANYASRGSVSGSGTYPAGTNVVINATPADGFFFVCWNDGDTLNPRIVSSSGIYTAMFFALHTDTLTLVDTVTFTDTVYQTLYDTLLRVDTVFPTFVHLNVTSEDPWRGLVAGNATVPAGTQIEMAAVPLEGNVFSRWSDGSTENPRRVQVNQDMSFTASFEGAAGISAPDMSWTATVADGVLSVGARVGETLRLYDTQGRCLLTMVTVNETTAIRLPSAGIYLVQLGDGPARRISSK